MKQINIPLLSICVLVAVPNHGACEEISAHNSTWTVVYAGDQPCSTCPLGNHYFFKAENAHQKTSYQFVLRGSMRNVEAVSLYGSTASILGMLNYSGNVVFLYNLDAKHLVAELRGYNFAPSPSGRFVVFKRFYPRFTPPELVSDVLLIYDLQRAPFEHHVATRAIVEGAVGIPIFPQENAFSISLEPQINLHHYIVNPQIAWSPSSESFAWTAQQGRIDKLMSRGHDNRAIIVGACDLSEGVHSARVWLKELTRDKLIGYKLPGANEKIRFVLRDLRVDDRGSVTIIPHKNNRLKPSISVEPRRSPMVEYRIKRVGEQ